MGHRPDRVRLRPLLPLWAAVLAAAAAGALMDAAFPAVGLWPLAFVAVALVLVALDGRRIGGAILVAGVYGAVLYPLLVLWATRYLGPIPWLGLSGAEAALTAISLVPVSLAYRWVPRSARRARLLLLPFLVGALWTGHELFLGTWPYGGFPWARLAMTQAESPLAPLSSWVGVSGVSFLMVSAVAMIVEAVRMRLWRRPAALLAPALIVFVLVATPVFPTTPAGTIRVGAVQGNGAAGFFDEREDYDVITAQLDATEPLIGEELDLLVWPEGGVEYDPFQDPNTARRLTRIVDRIGAPLLANAATERGDDVFNTSFLWTPESADDPEAVQKHDKRHPVPFGEYVPDRGFYNAIVPDLVGLLTREYTPGTNPPILRVGDVGVGLAICFDVIYDEVIRESVLASAGMLAFQTNNADFRDTDENVQQLAFARMRAIEAGRSVLNISTVGTSQLIDAEGKTVASLGTDEAGALLEDVELRTGLTAGILLGPWIQVFVGVGGAAALVVAGVRRRRS